MSTCEERSHRRIPSQPLGHGISLEGFHKTLQDLDNPSATGAIVAAGAVSAVRAMLEQNMRMHVVLLAIMPRGERCGPLPAHVSDLPTPLTCPSSMSYSGPPLVGPWPTASSSCCAV